MIQNQHTGSTNTSGWNRTKWYDDDGGGDGGDDDDDQVVAMVMACKEAEDGRDRW